MKRIVAAVLMLTMLLSSCSAFADSFSDMLNKAEAYQLAGEDEKALACYQLAQQLNPDKEEGFLGEAELLMKQQDYANAATLIHQALEINPVSQAAWEMKCRLNVLNNDIASFETDSIFAEVCEADLSADHVSVAAMYAHAGMYEKAVHYFQLVDLNSLDPEQKMLYRLALVLSGKRDEAEELGLVSPTVRDAELDARFDADQLTLVRVTIPQIHVEDIEIASDFWKACEMEEPEDPYAWLAAELPEGSYSWYSFSPSGNSGIIARDGYPLATYYSGRYHIMYPSYTRSAADENVNLVDAASDGLAALEGEVGLVYSPDGRYTCGVNVNWAAYPTIIDLSTGEVIVTAIYKHSGYVTAATFSADGKYLYYVFYDRESATGDRSSLYRYNLESGETECCYSASDAGDCYYYGLAETQAGGFLALRKATKPAVTSDPYRYFMEYIKPAWSGSEYTIDSIWPCKRLLSSINSGYALVSVELDLSDLYHISAFQCIKPDEAFKGLNQYIVLTKDSHELKLLDAAALQAAIPDYSKPLEYIAAINLSPDGYYALLLTENWMAGAAEAESAGHIFLVRLDDMKIKEVKGLNPDDILMGNLSRNNNPVIEWNTDTLLINTKDGVQAYKFQ